MATGGNTVPLAKLPEGQPSPHQYTDGATALSCDTRESSTVDPMDSVSNGDLLSLNLELDTLLDPKVGKSW